MRPKKVILLWCDTEMRTEELRFVLTIRGFFVVTPEGMATGEDNRPIDAALVVQGLGKTQDAAYIHKSIELIREFDSVPIMFLKETTKDAVTDLAVEAFHAKGACVQAWIQQLKALANRKRGIKKQITQRESVAA